MQTTLQATIRNAQRGSATRKGAATTNHVSVKNFSNKWEVRMMFMRVINALFIFALLFVVAGSATVYGQRDRPDTVGSRSIGGKDSTQTRRDRKLAEDPQAKIDEQLRSNPRTANVNAMRREAITTAGTAKEVSYEDAIEQARLEYETKFKEDLKNEDFKNSHAFIRLEDFARAYIIALDSRVQAKITTAYELAKLRSETTTYDDYDEILIQKVPDLNKEEAKALAKNAKKVVKAALSNE